MCLHRLSHRFAEISFSLSRKMLTFFSFSSPCRADFINYRTRLTWHVYEGTAQKLCSPILRTLPRSCSAGRFVRFSGRFVWHQSTSAGCGSFITCMTAAWKYQQHGRPENLCSPIFGTRFLARNSDGFVFSLFAGCIGLERRIIIADCF